MKLTIIRHGETSLNKRKIMQGSTDAPLSKIGRIQANKLAKRLAKEKIDIIYCSDMKRCKQTIAPLLKLRKMPIIYTKELRERDFGVFEGQPMEKFVKWINKNRCNKYINHFLFKIKKGESMLGLKKRTNKKNVLLVTHGATKKTIIISSLKQSLINDYKRYVISNTGLSIMNFSKKGPRLKLLNCTKHLK